MGARNAAAGDSGGGAGIQALRPARARLITAAAALACLAAADGYAAATAGRLAGVDAAFGIASVALLAAGLVLRWPSTIPWSILLAAGGYLTGREGRATVDGWAALIGVALLVAAELASWSIDHDARIASERALVVRRVVMLAGLVVVALFVNLMLLAAAALTTSAGILLAAVGVAASVTAVAVVLRLLRT